MPMKAKSEDHTQQLRQTTHHHWSGSQKNFHAKHTPSIWQKILITLMIIVIIAGIITALIIE